MASRWTEQERAAAKSRAAEIVAEGEAIDGLARPRFDVDDVYLLFDSDALEGFPTEPPDAWSPLRIRGRIAAKLPAGHASERRGLYLAVDPVQVKVAKVSQYLGGKSALARYVGVSRSQPGRWMDAQELPSPESRRLVQDLEYVVGRLQGVWEGDTGKTWLWSSNAHLDGARPIDVLREEGPARVIAAIDAAAAGSYA